MLRMRPTPRRLVKSVFVITVIGFVVTNLNLLLSSVEDSNGATVMEQKNDMSMGVTWAKTNTSRIGNGSSVNGSYPAQIPARGVPVRDAPQPRDPHVEGSDLPHHPSGPNASFIVDFIQKINAAQKVHNLDKFDLKSGAEAVVIVVQVHNRVEYLRHLIDSLRKSKGIESTLVIFSHDLYHEEMNTLVQSIDFCPVLQIYYPYPNQIFSNEFPGEDPNDCPRDIKKYEAKQRKCNNADHPDKYGHYREAKYVQTKHHWFWKISHVFDYVTVMQHHTGPVLFIEEDHYLVPDFIPVLRQMVKLGQESCKECAIMTLGTYDKNPTYASNAGKGIVSWLFGSDAVFTGVEITDWVSNKHNMGMALNRSIWQKIKDCALAFCKFDDYNWDWSLQFVSLTCIKGRLKVMLMKSPRIFHIGECGVHHKGKNCNPAEKVAQLEGLLGRNKQYLYPDKLTILGYPRSLARLPKPNGGWGDVRDHHLCSRFVNEMTHR